MINNRLSNSRLPDSRCTTFSQESAAVRTSGIMLKRGILPDDRLETTRTWMRKEVLCTRSSSPVLSHNGCGATRAICFRGSVYDVRVPVENSMVCPANRFSTAVLRSSSALAFATICHVRQTRPTTSKSIPVFVPFTESSHPIASHVREPWRSAPCQT